MSLRNDFRLIGRALAAGGRRPDFPYKLTLVLTNRCNLRCRMCHIWEDGSGGLSLEEIRAFFARSNRFSWVDLTGGEIFLREDILEVFAAVLRECRQLALLHFPTNGYLVERVVGSTRELLRMRPPRLVVTVSVDGPPALHDELRGVEGSFERAVESWARLRELPGCRALLGMTLSEPNFRSVAETLEAVRRRVPRAARSDLHINLLHRSDHYYRNGSLPAPPRDPLIRELERLRKGWGITVDPAKIVERTLLLLGQRYVADGKCPIPCAALSAGCFTGADGTVYPCVSWSRPLGKLADFDYDLGRLWASPEAVDARSAVVAGTCPHCWTACESVPSLLSFCGKKILR